MQQLIKQVEQWADDRNLIDGSNPKKQMLKLMEEFGELCGGIAKNKPEVIKDSIGDCLVVTIILACQMKASRWFIDKALVDSDCSTENNEFICMRLAGVLGNLSKLIIFRNGIYNINEVYSNFYEIVYFLNKLAINKEINLESCLSLAWQEIKDRKGRMIDGVICEGGGLINDE
ncbi:MazG-like family protein [Actinobacillus pleuropneumoniae]|uniref:MazG-like family protein n=1 Tax=Actinobacillus pleuropneumoniae TaxID=715 RepID=UPI000045D916|nr:MazG-like family protein [Actinobacillus pleuropneumoniae]